MELQQRNDGSGDKSLNKLHRGNKRDRDKHTMILKVEVIEGGTSKPMTRRELTGKELEEWKRAHGYTAKEKIKSDTDGGDNGHPDKS